MNLMQLTKRETEVLTLLATGMRSNEVGATLHIATSTVRNIAGSAYKKLRVRNRQEAFLKLGWSKVP
jgi:DNA-binding NarL/FixJ family response regulator